MTLHPDFEGFLAALEREGVEFVVVGAFSLAFHGHPRATGDLDLWIKPSLENADSAMRALKHFGFGSLELSEKDFLSEKIIQLGHPPVRIDFLSRLDGVDEEEIWSNKVEGALGSRKVFFLGKTSLIQNKQAVGRPQDLADIQALNENP